MEPFQFGRFLNFFVSCEKKTLVKGAKTTDKTKRDATAKIEDETEPKKAPSKAARKSGRKNSKRNKQSSKIV